MYLSDPHIQQKTSQYFKSKIFLPKIPIVDIVNRTQQTTTYSGLYSFLEKTVKCPLCGNLNDKVLESRQNSSGTSIRRRRECSSCSYRFTSYEKIEEIPLMVIKGDGRRQPFDIKKIERGVHRAVEKRPIPQRTIENLLHEIEDEAELEGKGRHEISSDFIGSLILGKLAKLDQIAYIRFASVYKKFKDVKEFIKEIETL